MSNTTTTLVSAGDDTRRAFADEVSADGRYVLYSVETGATSGDYWLADLQGGGAQFIGSGLGTFGADLSPDGRYVAFASPTTDGGEIKLWDRTTGSSQVLVTITDGTFSFGSSLQVAPDDSAVYFVSASRHLVIENDDAFDQRDLYRVDVSSKAVTQVYEKAAEFIISDGGRFGLLTNYEENLVNGTTHYHNRIDLSSGQIQSYTGDLVDPTNLSSRRGSISADGRYVVFEADRGPGGISDEKAYLVDFLTAQTQVVSSSTGSSFSGFTPVISADGSRVAFVTPETSLDPSGDAGARHVVVKDLATGTMADVVDLGTKESLLSISADGLSLAYYAEVQLTPADADSAFDAYVTRFFRPQIAITSISGDGYVNASDETSPIPVAGTSDAIGRTVTVTSPTGATGIGIVQQDGTWAVNVPAAGVPDGSRTFTATVLDDVAIRGTASGSAVFDSVPPTLTIGDVYINAADKAAGTKTLSGTSDAIGQTVILFLDDAPFATAVVQPAGTWSVTVDVSGLDDGDRQLEFGVVDPAGNRTDRDIFLTIDTTPPQIAIRTIGGDNVLSAAELGEPVPVVGTSDAIGRTVTIWFGSYPVGTAEVQPNGTWAANVDDLRDVGAGGIFALTATVSDLAGNEASATGSAFADSDIIRVSVATDGTQGVGDPFQIFGFAAPSLSADARYVVFYTDGRTNLTPGDLGTHLLLKDMQTRELSQLDGNTENFGGSPGEITDDGRYVLYTRTEDRVVVLLDRTTGVTTQVNTNAAGEPDNGYAGHINISGDGRFVVFASGGTNLVASPPPAGSIPYYAKDLQTGEVTLIPFAQPENDPSRAFLNVSHVGGDRYVAFSSLVPAGPDDTNGARDVFLRDLQTGDVTLISATASGAAGNDDSTTPEVSPNGRYVAFYSLATDLIAGQTLPQGQVYLRDLQTGQLRLLSADETGAPLTFQAQLDGSAGLQSFAFTADDRYVAFLTFDRAVPEDGNRAADVYLKDLQTGELRLLTPGHGSGSDIDLNSLQFDLTPDGRYIVFSTQTPSLVPGDTNVLYDVFLRRLAPANTLTLDPVAGDDVVTPAEASASGRAIPVHGTTSAAPGSTVSITVDGIELATTLVQADHSWSATIDMLGLTRTEHNLVASVLDGPGFTASDGAILDIQPGARTLVGTPGDDVIPALPGDSVDGLGGNDTVDFSAAPGGSMFADPQSGISVSVSAFTSVENLIGTAFEDSLLGDSGPNRLAGGPGQDELFGNPGDDVLLGGPAPAGKPNHLDGGDGVDTAAFEGVTAKVYADLRTGGGHVGGVLTDLFVSIENLTGGSGDDLLVGNDGANVLAGGSGADELQGMGGDDVLIGGSAAAGSYNQLFGGAGSDSASYAGQTASVRASLEGTGAYIDTGGGVLALVDAYSSIENLTGGSGADILVGDAGANRIQGGGEADQLYGRAGADTFVFKAASDSNLSTGYDTVADFQTETDHVDLSAFGIDASRVFIGSDATSTALYADTDLGTAGYELAVSFAGTNAVAIGDIVF